MRILNLISKDIRQLVRDWMTIFFMLVMPVVFTLMFGFVFSGAGGSDEDQRLPVGYLDLDGGAQSQEINDLLTESDVIRLESAGSTKVDLEEAVADEELAGALIIPEGYSQGALAGEPRSLVVIVNRASTSGITVQQEIQSTAMRMASSIHWAG